MRDGWEETTLGDVADVVMGRQLSPDKVKGVRPRRYLRAGNIGSWGIDVLDVLEMDFTQVEEDKFACQVGDVLLVEGGNEKSVGSPAIVSEIEQGLCIQNTIIRCRSKASDALLPEYLYQFLAAQFLRGVFGELCTGTTIKHLGQKRAFVLPVLLPPPVEQRRIVDVMESVDNYIAALQERLDAARAMSMAVLIKEFQNPSCEARQLSSFCDRDDVQIGPFGSQLHSHEYVESGVPVVMPKDIVNGEICEASVARVSSAKADSLKRHLLRPGDVLFARRGDLSKRALVKNYQKDWICGTGTVRVRSRLLDGRTLFRATTTPEVNAWLISSAVGATMPNLNTDLVRAIPIRVREGATYEDDLLDQIDVLIDSIIKLFDAAKIARFSLLSDLLSGEHEIPESYDKLLGAA